MGPPGQTWCGCGVLLLLLLLLLFLLPVLLLLLLLLLLPFFTTVVAVSWADVCVRGATIFAAATYTCCFCRNCNCSCCSCFCILCFNSFLIRSSSAQHRSRLFFQLTEDAYESSAPLPEVEATGILLYEFGGQRQFKGRVSQKKYCNFEIARPPQNYIFKNIFGKQHVIDHKVFFCFLLKKLLMQTLSDYEDKKMKLAL